MPILKKTDVRPERPVIVMLYGVPGCGKTSIATTANNPVIIDTDRGADRAVQVIDTLAAQRWQDILEVTEDLKEYKTIIIDTAKTMLDEFLSVYVCEQNYKLRTNSLKRFGEMASEFSAFVSRLQTFGTDLIFICHDKESQEGDIIKHSPDCTGSSKNYLQQKADQIGYVSSVNGHRTISFQPKDNFVGKDVAGIGSVQIPDYGSEEFGTFMAGIIGRVKKSIQGKSEAQRKASELVASLREQLAAVIDNDGATALINSCKELPSVMKAPFFTEIKKTLAGKGFTYADGKFTITTTA